jgi:hypothetical protein
MRRHFSTRILAACAMAAALLGAYQARAEIAVTTYHNDTYRTGWNQAEHVLNIGNVSKLALQHQVALDAQSDTQPLLVPALNLGSAGTHDVVYVATAANTLYGVDAQSGAILLHRNFGTPVSQSTLPGQCGNNDSTVGITGTPVIDRATGTLYLIAYLAGTDVPRYELHAVSLTTLADTITPQTITAIAKVSNGTPYYFQPTVTRQRAALLQSHGNIYAAFASFCDFVPRSSRGWVLGWKAKTLAPLVGTDLVDRRWSAPNQQFLSSIWMSGFGLAADQTGSVYFATSNSDRSGHSWAVHENLAESVVKLSSVLGKVESFFTPTGTKYGQVYDDQTDNDVGSGGVMLVPEAAVGGLHLAVAAGKVTPVMLLDRDNLGGRGQNFLAAVSSGGCYCGPSFFTGADGVARVVIGTGNIVTVYQLPTSPKPVLTLPVRTSAISTGQDPGLFTAISSNGTKAGTALVWAVTRPVNFNPGTIKLLAIDPTDGTILLNVATGAWPNPGGNANVVPTVANGQVYVASYKTLTIFGLTKAPHGVSLQAVPAPAQLHLGVPHQVTGTITALTGTRMTLRRRDGSSLTVDFDAADRAGLAAIQAVGATATVRGDFRGTVLLADAVQHAKPSVGNWPADW